MSNDEHEISIKDVAAKIRSNISYIKSRWKTILICGIIFAGLGLCYSLLVKKKYTAVCTFVLDESNTGGLISQYSGLAAMAGIDLNSSGGGLFKGDNIIELYKSRTMIEKALLSEGVFNGKREKLIDRYISSNDLLDKWKSDDKIQSINFDDDPLKFNRKQDSLISDLVITFNKKYLDVEKPDKKLIIISVNFIAKDELFAKEFTENLVSTVNNFYVQTKTKKTAQDVALLQQQADSVKRILNSSIGGVASSIDATPNPNPALLVLRVPSQRKQIDVQASSAIYSEMVKNLEISKIALRQQTPLIQIIDQPVLPLPTIYIGKIKGIVIGAILGLFLAVFYLLVKRLFKSILNVAV